MIFLFLKIIYFDVNFLNNLNLKCNKIMIMNIFFLLGVKKLQKNYIKKLMFCTNKKINMKNKYNKKIRNLPKLILTQNNQIKFINFLKIHMII